MELESIWGYGSIEDITAVWNRLYCSSGNVLKIYDVSDPSNPRWTGDIPDAVKSLGLGGPRRGNLIAANERYIACVRGHGGITILDANTYNRKNYELVSGDPTAIDIKDNLIYTSTGGSVEVVDINSMNPQTKEIYNIDAQAVEVYQDLLITLHGYQCDIYRLTPRGIAQVFTHNMGKATFKTLVYGNLLFVSTYEKVDIIDLSSMTHIGTYISDVGSRYKTLAVQRNYLYVTEHDAGIDVVDISNPTSPRKIGFLNYSGGYPRAITAIRDSHVGVAISYAGFDVIDATNPLGARVIYHEPAYGKYLAIEINDDGTIVYGGDDRSLCSFDATEIHMDNMDRVDVGSTRTINMIRIGNDIWVCHGAIGLIGYNITNPFNLIWHTKINTPWYYYDVESDGTYLYTSALDGILRIYEINTIKNQWIYGEDTGLQLSNLDLYQSYNLPNGKIYPGNPSRPVNNLGDLLLDESNGILYAIADRTITLIDVSNPEAPEMIDFIDGIKAAKLEFGPGNLLFIFAEDRKLWAIDRETHMVVDSFDPPGSVAGKFAGYMKPGLAYSKQHNILFAGISWKLFLFDVSLSMPFRKLREIDFKTNEFITDIKLSKDGKNIAMSCGASGVRRFDVQALIDGIVPTFEYSNILPPPSPPPPVCIDGETKIEVCPDGTEIITHICESGEWIETGSSCESLKKGTPQWILFGGALLLFMMALALSRR